MSSRPTRSRATPRRSASRRASGSAAAASCSLSCSGTRRPMRRICGSRRRPPVGGCPAAQRPWRVAEADLDRVARRLPADALAGSVDGIGCALVSGPATRAGRLSSSGRPSRSPPRSARPCRAGELGSSWALANAALRAAEAGAIEGSAPIVAEQHLADLLIFESGGLADRLVRTRLEPLAELTPAARERMEETALAFVQHGGNAAAMARALHLHPQTIRYRLTRLKRAVRRAARRPRRALRARAGPQVESGSSGSSRLTTAPPSVAFAARAVPPCSSATRWTIARPSPEPGLPRASSERQKRSKTLRQVGVGEARARGRGPRPGRPRPRPRRCSRAGSTWRRCRAGSRSPGRAAAGRRGPGRARCAPRIRAPRDRRSARSTASRASSSRATS